MKLNIEKQKVSTLSSNEMNNISGGGIGRSNRLGGGCSYSRKFRHQNPCGDTIGCHEKDFGLCRITVSS